MQKREIDVEHNVFEMWTNKRKITTLEGTTKRVSGGSEIRDEKFRKKFAEVQGDKVNPLTAPFDPEVVMLAGKGKKKVRFWIGDGSVPPS